MLRNGVLNYVHPAVRIGLWILLALMLPGLSWRLLIGLCIALSAVAWRLYSQRFLRILRRNRILLLSILFLYGFVTPGRSVGHFWPVDQLTAEGLAQGFVQSVRLLVMLASLAWLLGGLSRDKLMQGVLHLLQPFAIVGLNVERLAVRLTLTLEFIDHHIGTKSSRWREELDDAIHGGEREAHLPIRLQPQAIAMFEWLALLLMAGLVIYCRLGG